MEEMDGREDGSPAMPGLDLGAITAWLRSRTMIEPPLRAVRATGGRSNLTYVLTDAEDRRIVVRRPPLHGVLSSAHDVVREHRILTALAPTDVPVPICFGVEEDPEVIGAPFYAMEHVDGLIVQDRASALRLPPAQRRASSDSLIDVLARLHAVDLDQVGLGDLARREDYLARQLHRWHTQLEAGRTRDVSVLDDVHDRLAAAIPDQGPATIVHGDYRLDNLVLDTSTGEVAAVLDWELTTLGDPLADLGLLLVYWVEASDTAIALPDPPTLAPGFATREELLDRYSTVTGRDLSEIGYHVAFGYWKLACILEGVHGRYVSGAYGDDADGFAGIGDLVLVLGERAAEAAAEVGR